MGDGDPRWDHMEVVLAMADSMAASVDMGASGVMVIMADSVLREVMEEVRQRKAGELREGQPARDGEVELLQTILTGKGIVVNFTVPTTSTMIIRSQQNTQLQARRNQPDTAGIPISASIVLCIS